MSTKRRYYYLGLTCVIAPWVLLLCAWLIPVHLRAVDGAVIRIAGENSRGATARDLTPGLTGDAGVPGLNADGQAVTPFLMRSENREKALAAMAVFTSPVVRELARCRALNDTVLFPPSSSASGQAFDAAIALSGLLLQGNHLAPGMSDAVLTCATAANRGESSRPIEEILLDTLSLGQRFDWPHLLVFTRRIDDPHTLAVLTEAVRNARNQLPVLYSAVEMSQQPSEVARYISDFSRTGLHDLGVSEAYGAGGVDELLRRDQRLYVSDLRQKAASFAPLAAYSHAVVNYALRSPRGALALQFFLYLTGGYLVAVALRLVLAPAARTARSSYRPRELLFASGVLLAALLLSEPFLAQENQKGEAPFRLRLPSVGAAVASQITHVRPSFMNTQNMTASLLTLLLFFILQALIYAACLARLAETLSVNVSARVKLRLLENEDNLFDAGLYLGFVGTIICLILVSLGVLQFSLMAAYSSTSFGIIFVSILKIFKVRPARRRLLLQAEEENTTAEARVPLATHNLVPVP